MPVQHHPGLARIEEVSLPTGRQSSGSLHSRSNLVWYRRAVTDIPGSSTSRPLLRAIVLVSIAAVVFGAGPAVHTFQLPPSPGAPIGDGGNLADRRVLDVRAGPPLERRRRRREQCVARCRCHLPPPLRRHHRGDQHDGDLDPQSAPRGACGTPGTRCCRVAVTGSATGRAILHGWRSPVRTIGGARGLSHNSRYGGSGLRSQRSGFETGRCPGRDRSGAPLNLLAGSTSRSGALDAADGAGA